MLGAEPQPNDSGKQPRITRENEPEDYWRSDAERQGKSPWQDPMAWAALSGILVPLVFLAVGFATGYLEMH